MRSTLLGAVAALAMVISAPAGAAVLLPGMTAFQAAPSSGADPFYTLDFTDVHGDSGELTLQLSSPLGAGGDHITSITGTLDGFAASADPGLFGGDQLVYGTGPLADYSGIGLTDAHGDLLNLYFTDPNRGGSGELAICYIGSCNQTSGFYAVDSFSLTAIPEPGSWLLLALGVGAIGGALRQRKLEPRLA